MTDWSLAECRDPLWRTLTEDEQRRTCVHLCAVRDACHAKALGELARLDPIVRREVIKDRHPDIWAGHTLREIDQQRKQGRTT